jgi:hypothetical protein
MSLSSPNTTVEKNWCTSVILKSSLIFIRGCKLSFFVIHKASSKYVLSRGVQSQWSFGGFPVNNGLLGAYLVLPKVESYTMIEYKHWLRIGICFNFFEMYEFKIWSFNKKRSLEPELHFWVSAFCVGLNTNSAYSQRCDV